MDIEIIARIVMDTRRRHLEGEATKTPPWSINKLEAAIIHLAAGYQALKTASETPAPAPEPVMEPAVAAPVEAASAEGLDMTAGMMAPQPSDAFAVH